MSEKKVTYHTSTGMGTLQQVKPAVPNVDDEDEDENDEREDTWKDFCDTTSIHGLRYIGGNNPPPIGYRIIWGVIWVIMFVLCIWLCTNSIQQYLSFDVNTATTFQVVEKIDFPGITVCNENMFLRSRVGHSYEFMKTMGKLFSINGTKDEIEKLAKENNETCYYPTDAPGITSQLNRGINYWKEKGFVQGMRNITTDSYASVAKVWWNSTDIPVDGNFLNHALDHTICFTFNPGEKMVSSITQNNAVMPIYGYGLNVTNYQEKVLINAGPHNGLRLLLNTGQSDYCGVGHKWNGAGFKAIVHEPNMQPWFLLQPALSFSPGFDINIVLKPTMFYRKTSNLGRCKDDIYLYLSPDYKNMYYKVACYYQCFTIKVVQRCNCFPSSAYRYQDRDYPVVIDGKTVNLTNFCWDESMTCQTQVEEDFLQNNPDSACPLCEEPCYETKYEFEISSLLFPSDHLAELYAEELNTSVSLLNDNYLLINFHYESMNMRVIDETQGFTLLDLFTYFGGILGLFLGMSVMSIAEVFHQARISAKVYMRKRRQTEAVNSNLSTILGKNGAYAKPQRVI